MKKQTLIYLAIAAAAGYYFYNNAKKNKDKYQTKVIEEKEEEEPAYNEVPKPKKIDYPSLPKQLPAYSYIPSMTIKPVAQTLDTIKNAIFAKPTKPFTMNPSKQKAATKKKAKKAKLGELGVSYLYV
jgi:hypothetical protein